MLDDRLRQSKEAFCIWLSAAHNEHSKMLFTGIAKQAQVIEGHILSALQSFITSPLLVEAIIMHRETARSSSDTQPAQTVLATFPGLLSDVRAELFQLIKGELQVLWTEHADRLKDMVSTKVECKVDTFLQTAVDQIYKDYQERKQFLAEDAERRLESTRASLRLAEKVATRWMRAGFQTMSSQLRAQNAAHNSEDEALALLWARSHASNIKGVERVHQETQTSAIANEAQLKSSSLPLKRPSVAAQTRPAGRRATPLLSQEFLDNDLAYGKSVPMDSRFCTLPDAPPGLQRFTHKDPESELGSADSLPGMDEPPPKLAMPPHRSVPCKPASAPKDVPELSGEEEEDEEEVLPAEDWLIQELMYQEERLREDFSQAVLNVNAQHLATMYDVQVEHTRQLQVMREKEAEMQSQANQRLADLQSQYEALQSQADEYRTTLANVEAQNVRLSLHAQCLQRLVQNLGGPVADRVAQLQSDLDSTSLFPKQSPLTPSDSMPSHQSPEDPAIQVLMQAVMEQEELQQEHASAFRAKDDYIAQLQYELHAEKEQRAADARHYQRQIKSLETALFNSQQDLTAYKKSVLSQPQKRYGGKFEDVLNDLNRKLRASELQRCDLECKLRVQQRARDQLWECVNSLRGLSVATEAAAAIELSPTSPIPHSQSSPTSALPHSLRPNPPSAHPQSPMLLPDSGATASFSGPGNGSTAKGRPHPPVSPAPASPISPSPSRSARWNSKGSHSSRSASGGPTWATRPGRPAFNNKWSPSHTPNPRSTHAGSEATGCDPSPPDAMAANATPRPISAPSQLHTISIDAPMQLLGTNPNIATQGEAGSGRAAVGRKLRSKVRKRPLHSVL